MLEKNKDVLPTFVFPINKNKLLDKNISWFMNGTGHSIFA